MATTYELIVKAVDQSSSPLGKVQASLVETEKKSKRLNNSLKKLGSGAVTGSLRTLQGGLKATAAAATVAAVAFTALARKNLNALEKIGQTADKLGVTTKFLTEYGEVAERAGLSTEQFQTGLQRFIRRLGQAQAGTGELLKPLKELGIEIKNTDGTFRDNISVYNDFMRALGGVTNKSRQLALAMGAFDTEGVAFVNIAAMGTEKINAFRKAAQEAGIVIGRDLAKDAREANDAISQLLDVATGFQLQFFGALAKPIEEAVTALRNNLIIRVEAAGGMEQFARTIASQFLKGVATLIQATSTMVDDLRNAFGTFANIMQEIIVSISKIPGVDFTATFDSSATINRSSIEEQLKTTKQQLIDEQVVLDLLIDEYKNLGIIGKMTSGSLGDAIDEQNLKVGALKSNVKTLTDELDSLDKIIVFEKFATDSTSASDAVKGLVERMEQLSASLAAAPITGLTSDFHLLAAAGKRQKEQQDLLNEALMLQLQQLMPKAQAALKQLMTDEERINKSYKDKKALLSEINTQLKNNNTLSDTQRNTLEQSAAALQRELNILAERIKMGKHVAEVYHSTEKALQTNADRRKDLANAIKQLETQMQSEIFNTERNKAIKLALVNALEQEEAVRRRLLGIPMTDKELKTSLEKQFKIRSDTIAQNERVVKQIIAENDLTKKQIDLYRQLAGLPALEKDPFEVKPFNEALDLAQKQFEFREAIEQQNQRIFDQMTSELGLTKEQTEALREQLGLRTEMSALENFKKGIEDQRKAYDSLNISVEEQMKLANELNVPYHKLREAMLQATSGMDMFKTESQILAEGIEKQFHQISQTIGMTLASAIADGRSMADTFKNIFKNMLTQILGMIIQSQINQAMANLFPQQGGGGGFGGGGGGLGMILGFGRMLLGFENGGVPPTNRPSIVGEGGAELFLPGTTGRVVPNDELQGMMGAPTVNFNINAIDTQTGTEFILKNKKQIEGVIQNAYERRGRRGIA